MRPLKTKSFFEGENRMTVDVAYQRVTGPASGHPFLHRGPAGVMGLRGKQISGGLRQNRTNSVISGVTAGQGEGQISLRRVSE